MITLDHIKEKSKFKTCVIHVPALEGDVKVRLFTREEIDGIRVDSTVNGKLKEELFQKQLLLRGLIEPALDEPAFDELAGGNGAVYYGLLNAVMEGAGLNALASRDQTRRTFSA